MTNEFWHTQKARFIDRFGERNFSKEFSLLVAIECKSMSDQDFLDVANAMIGARKPNDPPLIRDFRDARLAQERRKFERDLYSAANAMSRPAWTKGLKSYLSREFPGCKTLNEAVEVRRLQIQIEKSKNANYDPMADSKWMGTT